MTLEIGDTFTILSEIATMPDPLSAAERFDGLVRHLYWQEKDIQRMIPFACAAIQFCFTAAARIEDRDETDALLGWAKTIAYNLASFTWRGWAEPGITICQEEERLGLSAGRLNLRLAHDLSKGDLAVSRAQWLVGVQLMSAQNWSTAGDHFRDAADSARAAGEETEELLIEGYLTLLPLISDPRASDIERERHLHVKERLRKCEGGPELIEQLDMVENVYQTHS